MNKYLSLRANFNIYSMITHIRCFFGILFSFVIVCFASGQRNATHEKYISKYSQMAIQQAKKYNIPASITLAQGILESGGGTSFLATTANNHFGIKCHEWTGARAYKNAEIPNECFRKYSNVADSYEDHSLFLRDRPRYAQLFTLKKTDYKGWAKGLQSTGYATDKGYANKLIDIIERYQLYQYDTEKIQNNNRIIQQSRPSAPANYTVNLTRDIYKTYGLIYVIARMDDTVAQIAYDLGFNAKKLAKYNDIPINYPIQQGDIIYLQKKKTKADQPNYFHVVSVGESMHSISQRYGIQTKSLYKINKKKADFVPEEGDMLKLR